MDALTNSTLVAGWHSGPNERGTMDLIWSCFSTVFLCLWSMLHLNVPARRDSFWATFLRKTRWMVLGILAPEVPMMFACGQWSSANRSVREMRELGFGKDKWTLSHAFFADMGGIVVKMGDDEEPMPITAKQLAWLVRSGHTGLPGITELDIRDKSKADICTKLLAVLQTTWFMIQLIGRGAEHLPISPIELATAALALTSLTTLWFWHHKPLDAQQSYTITLEGTDVLKETKTELGKNSDKAVFETTIQSASPLASPAITPAFDDIEPALPPRNPTSLLTSLDEVEQNAYISRKWSPTLLHYICLLNLQRPRLDRIPNDRDPQILGFKQHFTLGIATAAFASLHFIDFNFPFLTFEELTLWRTACCVMWALLASYGSAEVYLCWREGYTKLGMDTGGGYKMRWPVCLWFFIPAGLYFLARVSVTVLVFISLRGLPKDAYREVQWTSVLPHI